MSEYLDFAGRILSQWVFSLADFTNLIMLLLFIFNLYYVCWRVRKKLGFMPASGLNILFCSGILGILAGVTLSLILSRMNLNISFGDVNLVLCLSLLLGAFRVRFLACWYAVGLLTLLSLSSPYWSLISFEPPILVDTVLEQIHNFAAGDWLYLTSILLIVEAVLLRLDTFQNQLLFELREHKKHKALSGFMLCSAWYVPIFVTTGSGGILYPAVLMTQNLNLTRSNKQHRRLLSTILLIYGLSFFAVVQMTDLGDQLNLMIVALLALFGREMIFRLWRSFEFNGAHCYLSDNRGLKVLAVVPGSPAHAMGIRVGDFVQRVNDRPIYTSDDLIEATTNAAYCRCEVLGEDGYHHVMHRALYENDKAGLGIVGAISSGHYKISSFEEPRQDVRNFIKT